MNGTRCKSSTIGLTILLSLTSCGYTAGEQTRPGSVDGVAGSPEPESSGEPQRSGWTAYIDLDYGFRIDHPQDMVVQPQPGIRWVQGTPAPVVSIFFMNPTMAAGDLAQIEPPDLELRIYQPGSTASLKQWLESVGFAGPESGASEEVYRNRNIEGIEVCRSTMMAPACSLFVLHSGSVYQLTPMSAEGEGMVETFSLPASL